MTLTEFLLARIAEDEEEASLFPIGPVDDNMTALVNKFAARVLARCEADRRIVEWVTDGGRYEPDDTEAYPLALLALPYADRPDYREEWKP